MPEPTRTLGPFSLIERLGGGGQGQVWKGMRDETGQVRAVKFIPLDNSDELNAEICSRAAREVEALRQLDDPRIVGVYGTGQEQTSDPLTPTRLWLEYELIEGRNVDKALRDSPPTVEEAFSLLDQLARAVQLLHDGGVIHRDIKPANIMLRGHAWEKPVLVDFGCVAVDGATAWTRTIHHIGTLDYMAPEVKSSARNASPASDQFSLAVLCCDVLLTAVGGDWTGQERKVVFKDVLEPKFPRMASCLQQARARSADERYPSVSEFREALLEAAREDGAIPRLVQKAAADSRLASVIQGLGFTVVDKRPSGGALWVVDETDAFSAHVTRFFDLGVGFAQVPAGGAATGRRPGWYAKPPVMTKRWDSTEGSGTPAICLLPMAPSEPTLLALRRELLEPPNDEVLAALAEIDVRGGDSVEAIIGFADSGPLAREWSKAIPGATVLFASQGKLFAQATLALKLRSPVLADLQWSEGGADEPHLMLLTDLTPCDISVGRVSMLLGFKDGFRVRALMTLSPSQSLEVASVLGWESTKPLF